MDVIHALWQGLAVATTPENLAWALAGCVLGTALGVLPGFGPSVAVALLLPMTFHVDITQAFIFFIAIACGGMYGGSTTSILLNIPGESASMVTAMEGNRMALNGRAGVALATAAIGSWLAGTLAALLVVWVAPWVAGIASRLGPAEIFMLMVMALGAVSAAIGKSTLRGMTALFVGLALACVGAESVTGVERWTAGWPLLLDGIDMVLVAVGLFVVAEVLHAAMFEGRVRRTLNTVGRVRMSAQDWKRSWRPWLRGTVIGAPFGCVPIGGIDMPTYVSYASERYMVRDAYRAEFGREGAIEGVAGPEAANNATVTAALIPLLVMGIPTSNTTAVMLGAFQNYGVLPGPQWFTSGHSFVWVLIASLFIGNAMLWVLNMPMVRMWTVLLRIPRPQLYAAMLVLAAAGVYGMRQSVGDLLLLYGMGLLGVAMRRFDFPLTPLVIGVALGPLAEVQLRQAVAVGNGSLAIFVQQPLALTLLMAVVALVVLPRALQGWANHRMAQARAAAQQEQL
ncbi:tripartite tricarboxylate transporter permease [Comamonas jiangduensis]|uniref:tripartite tricarboxylate transporter permease n=1 Tax=Comamonas jiangduensis TaxID=1194168 RepID=UPI0024E05477|nr:tripartite tricarboxylate transporter permease [Comamonas jiangduensis]